MTFKIEKHFFKLRLLIMLVVLNCKRSNGKCATATYRSAILDKMIKVAAGIS